MANNLSVFLNATLSVTDTTLTLNPTIITRNLNNQALVAQQDAFSNFYQIGTSAVSIPFPPGVSIVYIVYIKNLHSTNNVLVALTPNGGVSASGGVVAPGGIFMYFQTTETAGTAVAGISNGITAVSLTASAASTPVEVLIAA